MLWLCLDLTILDVRWPLLFFSETEFIYNYLHNVQKWTKNQCGKLKKFHDFCRRDIEFCHHAAAKRVKLWSLNANLFLQEPRQLTKFVLQVHSNHIWQRKFPFKVLIAICWDLQSLWPSAPTKPDLLRFRCSSEHVLSKTKSVTPIFFTFLTSLTHHLSMVKFSEKINVRKFWRERP